MITLGIDIAQNGFHAVALNRKADGETFMEVFREVVEIDKKVPVLRSSVLGYIFDNMTQVMTDIGMLWADPDEDNTVYVFIEEPPKVRNMRTMLMLAETAGAIVAGATRDTRYVYLIPVSSWKQATCGAGNAGKPQVADWLNRVHPNYAALCDGSQDLTDSCCLALYGLTVVADAELVRTVGSSGQL